MHRQRGRYIADEVQAGFGRTGGWWDFGRHEVRPDMVVLGKPMGSGLPIAALMSRPDLLDAFGRKVTDLSGPGGSAPGGRPGREPGPHQELSRAPMDARSNEVAAQLQIAILDGSYLPGTPLREAALADRYAVSRRTIREALLVLADQGLAVHRHNSGASVRRFTADDIADLYRVRRILECEGARRVPNADESQLALVGKAYEAFAAAASGGVRSVALAQADAAFHGAVIGLVGSLRIADFYERIGAQMTYAICLVRQREQELAVKRDVILGEHHAIRDAISNRDVFEAQGLILAHIATHEQNAFKYWSVQP